MEKMYCTDCKKLVEVEEYSRTGEDKLMVCCECGQFCYDIDTKYKEFVIVRQRAGRFHIFCKKGLWAVDSPDKAKAKSEARHYFAMYYEDGEYGN